MIILKSKLYMSSQAEKQIRDNILKQKETGVIVIQPYFDVIVTDADTKIEVMYSEVSNE